MALVVAIALIVGVLLFANSLVGNPISKALAKSTAEKHIKETYANTDYELEDLSYSFKDGYYHALVSSESSIDTTFELLINGFGKLKYDNYDYTVSSGWSTAERLNTDYRNVVKGIFDSGSFPYNEYIGYGELVFVPDDQKNEDYVTEYAIITSELELDAFYNVNEMGSRAGRLTVYIDDENVSASRMAEILLAIRKCFDDSGVGFYAIECVLTYPEGENGEVGYDIVEVIDFRYADIYEEGLIERVEAADKAAKDYNSVLDEEKLLEGLE